MEDSRSENQTDGRQVARFRTAFSRRVLRGLLWVLTHTLYRIKVFGRLNVPEQGGALLVCNHLSHVDALLLVASTRRHIRFIMFKGIYERPWIKPFARILGVIPISSDLRPREMIQSLRDASDAIKQGEIVCIFAEGQITRIGQMLPFRRGFERIMKDVEAPIIPVARRCATGWTGQRMVSLLLPPSVPGALANYAALLMGKAPVNLNYTLSQEALASCIRQCDIQTVLTSRSFLEKVKLSMPCEL